LRYFCIDACVAGTCRAVIWHCVGIAVALVLTLAPMLQAAIPVIPIAAGITDHHIFGTVLGHCGCSGWVSCPSTIEFQSIPEAQAAPELNARMTRDSHKSRCGLDLSFWS